MIVTKLIAGGEEFSALSTTLMTPDEIREWERDMVYETEQITAQNKDTGERYRFLHGDWVEMPKQTPRISTAA